jgi:hypothetical protein
LQDDSFQAPYFSRSQEFKQTTPSALLPHIFAIIMPRSKARTRWCPVIEPATQATFHRQESTSNLGANILGSLGDKVFLPLRVTAALKGLQ